MGKQLSTGGGKHHKKKRNFIDTSSRELVFKEDGQEYAIVNKLLGNRRCAVKTPDGRERLGIIRGNMRKSTNLICSNDIVLLSLRDFQDSKADIVHVYKQDEVKSLIRYEEITDQFVQKDDRNELSLSNIVFEENIDNI